MTLLPTGTKVHLAFGYIDMRKGIDGLALLVQGVLRQDPFCGHLFVFRGRRANLIEIVFWDGTGLCLFTKRLEQGVFLWPSNVEPVGTLALLQGLPCARALNNQHMRNQPHLPRCDRSPPPARNAV